MSLDSILIESRIRATQITALDVGSAYFPVDRTISKNWTSGGAANQADRLFTDTRTLGANATEDLDLTGVLLDAFGAAITFARIKAVRISAADANTNSVLVTNTTSAHLFLAAGDGIALAPGDNFLWSGGGVTGKPVIASDLLTVANSTGGTGVTYTVEIIGAST